MNKIEKERMEKNAQVRDRVITRRLEALGALLGRTIEVDSTLYAIAKVHTRKPDFDLKQCLADMVVQQHKAQTVLLEDLAQLRMRFAAPSVTTFIKEKVQS